MADEDEKLPPTFEELLAQITPRPLPKHKIAYKLRLDDFLVLCRKYYIYPALANYLFYLRHYYALSYHDLPELVVPEIVRKTIYLACRSYLENSIAMRNLNGQNHILLLRDLHVQYAEFSKISDIGITLNIEAPKVSKFKTGANG